MSPVVCVCVCGGGASMNVWIHVYSYTLVVQKLWVNVRRDLPRISKEVTILTVAYMYMYMVSTDCVGRLLCTCRYLYLPVRVSTAQSLWGDGEGWPHRVQGVLDVLKWTRRLITVDQNCKEVKSILNVIQTMIICTYMYANVVSSSVFGLQWLITHYSKVKASSPTLQSTITVTSVRWTVVKLPSGFSLANSRYGSDLPKKSCIHCW